MEYLIKQREDGKVALFDSNYKMLSPEWLDKIYTHCGIFKNQSIYYIGEKDGKQAIFDIHGNQISPWFQWIYCDGLVEGRSKFYIAKQKGKMAIFDVYGNIISPRWFDWLDIEWANNPKEVYLACEERNCIEYEDGDYYEKYCDNYYAVFSIKGEMLSPWIKRDYEKNILEHEGKIYAIREKDRWIVLKTPGVY
jgi:hypothetical protein